jgi:cytochrome c553
LINRTAAKVALLLAWVLARRASRERPVSDSTFTGLAVRTIIGHPWMTLSAAVLLAAIAGLIVVASGVVPIKASSGHWRITAALLDFAKVRSVTTHSVGIRPPMSLDDPSLVLRGAGHYESGCSSCHGRPGSASIPPVAAAMTPTPPALSNRIRRWQPQELFSIVKHGIKFTGMPAWPVLERDDEVWAMVAFLRRMPAMDAPAYRALVFGQNDNAAPGAIGARCQRCHGADGRGRGGGGFPSLAGQRGPYLYASLRAFANRRRLSGIMTTVASELDDQTMREAAAYYERVSLPIDAAQGGRADTASNPSMIDRGAALASFGVHDRDIPSCNDCHGPSATPKNPAYPLLAGQHARYLALQLELFQQRRRGGSGFENLMHVFVDRLRPDEINDVAAYYASLGTARIQ